MREEGIEDGGELRGAIYQVRNDFPMSESHIGAYSTETFVVMSDMLQGIAALLAVSSWSAAAHWVRSVVLVGVAG